MVGWAADELTMRRQESAALITVISVTAAASLYRERERERDNQL